MAKKSKRGSGPRPGSNRAERVAARRARQAESSALPVRPFAGLRSECDLVALRAFVASATAPAPLLAAGGNDVNLATILPGAVAALARERGSAAVGFAALQTNPEPGDLPGQLASALTWAASAAPGSDYRPAPAPGITEVLDPDAALDITVHNDFDWWFADSDSVPTELAQMLEQANEAVLPTARIGADISGELLGGAPLNGAPLNGAPWWVDAGERAHLRWVRPEGEDDLMSAMARLHAEGLLTLGDGSRFAGSFRTHGVLVPVFDLDAEMHPEEWVKPCADFDAALTQALADTSELTAAQRRSRDGIRGRQVTLR